MFDIRFDEFQFESQFSGQSREIIAELDRRGFCQLRSDGVREANIPARYNSLPRDARFVVQKSDGTTLYLSRSIRRTEEKSRDERFFRDIAALKFRLETMPIEKILYVVKRAASVRFVPHSLGEQVDSSQTEHFRNLLTASKALGLKQVQNW